MIEKLILSIVTFSLISTMIANLTSDSVYRKYISGFSGILFVIMIINPVISMVGDDVMDKLYDKWQFGFIRDDYKMDSIGWEEEYIKATNKEYEELVKDKIASLIGGLCEVKKCEITMEEDVESEDYGKIYQVVMTVGIKGEKENKEDEILDITKVTIGENAVDKSESKGYKEMLSEVRKRIGEYFELEDEQIIIDYL